jgi:hypothetical protein
MHVTDGVSGVLHVTDGSGPELNNRIAGDLWRMSAMTLDCLPVLKPGF